MTLLDQLKRVYGPLLLAAYGAFLCSYFVLQDYSSPYRFFATLVFVPGLFVLVAGLRSVQSHPLFRAIVAYMAYSLISCFWSDPFEWYRTGQKLTICAYLLGFIGITQFLVKRDATLFDQMLRVCTLFAAASSAVSIALFYTDHSFPETRMATAIGSLTNINEFANIYSIFAILALHFAMQSKSIPMRSAFLIAVAALVGAAWFGQSRTAFAAISIALLSLVIMTRPRARLYYVAALATLAVCLLLLFPDVIHQAFLRGQGLRPFIWTEVWGDIMTRPFFGNGLISTIAVETGKHSTTETAHNAYLQALWHGGLIGLALFLLVFGTALRASWRVGEKHGDYRFFCMLLFTACAMMTGVDSVIDRPKDQWMLFWFPMALLLARERATVPGPVAPVAAARSVTPHPGSRASAS